MLESAGRMSPARSMQLPHTVSEVPPVLLHPATVSTLAIANTQPQHAPSTRVSSGRHGAHTPVVRQVRDNQHDRQTHRRHSRRRQNQQSLASWMWLQLCCHIRKSTIDFFDAVDAGRVDMVREMVKVSPTLLLRTRPGTRWTAVHFAAERGEFSTLTSLFEESQALDERKAGSQAHMRCTGIGGRPNAYTKCMVNALTEKNLTPLMLACKRGCVAARSQLLACILIECSVLLEHLRIVRVRTDADGRL